MRADQTVQVDWLKVLNKGLITIPKKWRENLGIKPGEIIKAEKKDNQIVLKPRKISAPYRIYSQKELNEFVVKDQLPKDLKKKLDNNA